MAINKSRLIVFLGLVTIILSGCASSGKNSNKNSMMPVCQSKHAVGKSFISSQEAYKDAVDGAISQCNGAHVTAITSSIEETNSTNNLSVSSRRTERGAIIRASGSVKNTKELRTWTETELNQIVYFSEIITDVYNEQVSARFISARGDTFKVDDDYFSNHIAIERDIQLRDELEAMNLNNRYLENYFKNRVFFEYSLREKPAILAGNEFETDDESKLSYILEVSANKNSIALFEMLDEYLGYISIPPQKLIQYQEGGFPYFVVHICISQFGCSVVQSRWDQLVNISQNVVQEVKGEMLAEFNRTPEKAQERKINHDLVCPREERGCEIRTYFFRNKGSLKALQKLNSLLSQEINNISINPYKSCNRDALLAPDLLPSFESFIKNYGDLPVTAEVDLRKNINLPICTRRNCKNRVGPLGSITKKNIILLEGYNDQNNLVLRLPPAKSKVIDIPFTLKVNSEKLRTYNFREVEVMPLEKIENTFLKKIREGISNQSEGNYQKLKAKLENLSTNKVISRNNC